MLFVASTSWYASVLLGKPLVIWRLTPLESSLTTLLFVGSGVTKEMNNQIFGHKNLPDDHVYNDDKVIVAIINNYEYLKHFKKIS